MKKILIFLTFFIFIGSCSKPNFNLFGFGKKASEFEKLKINEYLWIASNDILSGYTGTQSNLKEGSIVTGWIISKKNQNIRFKISVYVLGSQLLENNLQIVSIKEINKNGIWTQSAMSSAFSVNLKENIFLRARKIDPENYDTRE